MLQNAVAASYQALLQGATQAQAVEAMHQASPGPFGPRAFGASIGRLLWDVTKYFLPGYDIPGTVRPPQSSCLHLALARGRDDASQEVDESLHILRNEMHEE